MADFDPNFEKYGGPQQFLSDVRDLRRLGSTDKEIAENLGIASVEDLRTSMYLAHETPHTADLFKAPPTTDIQEDIDVSLDDADAFLLKAKRLAMEHYNAHIPQVGHHLTLNDVYVVWFSKVLQNWKALVSTNVSGDGVYYELTYNGDAHEAYVDVYSKVDNIVVPD